MVVLILLIPLGSPSRLLENHFSRPANKIGRRKDAQMTRDTAQLINCIKKRINPCGLEGLCLKIKNLISSTAFLSRQQK
ncbi:hypothetical protein CHARACLAT_007713 [Characodon lateralis]|uniref:Uncharacterized protein n=1 Tax=Characodon lateralis TaxID=208331 RepID=A0ABU7E7W4_9TELE|nr:hypothetical protein [Characodon lateralis]